MATREILTKDKLIELHIRKNHSLSEIGKMYGVSRQRVHQLKKEYEKECGKINRRHFIDVLTLKHYLEQGWTAKQIAEHFDMKQSKISRLIRKYKSDYEEGISNIKISKKRAEDLISKYELANLYLNELKTDVEIGEMFQLSPSTINLLRKKYNIPTNCNKKLRKLPNQLTKIAFERLYLIEGFTLNDIAEKYNCNVISIIRLKEKYGIAK